MIEWLHFLIGCLVGGTGGVLVMCLMHTARDPFDVECTHDCNQGRNCKCANEVHP